MNPSALQQMGQVAVLRQEGVSDLQQMFRRAQASITSNIGGGELQLARDGMA